MRVATGIAIFFLIWWIVLFAVFYWAYVTKAIAFDDLVTLWGVLKP